MPVEGFQRGLQCGGQVEGVQVPRPVSSGPWHIPPDMLPQIAKDRDLLAWNVVGHRNPGQLDNPAFDGVHQGEVAHSPWEKGSLGVTGAPEEEGSGRQVHHLTDAQLSIDHLQAGEPDPGFFAVLGRLLPFFRRQGPFIFLTRLAAVAMVSLVVQRHYVFHGHQFGHYPLDHLPFGFQCFQGLPRPLQQSAPPAGNFQALAQPQGVVVGDDDLGPLEVLQHISGDQFPAGVVAVRVVGLEHTKAVLDGEAGGHDQEAAGEPPAVWMPDGVDGLPGDKHGHDSGLAGAGRQFQGNT